ITDARPNRSPIVCAPTRKRPLSAGALRPGICCGTDVAGAAAPETEEVVVSRFTEKMYRSARNASTGMVTGEPHEPIRHTWGEVHERARQIAGVLAGFPVEIAPTAQGLWMRGASLTMLHQPTPRTDLVVWAEDTMNVVAMIEAKAVIVSEPFMVAVPVLEEQGITVLTVPVLLAADPIDPVEVGEDDLALMQLTSGSTGSPKAVQI